MAKAFIGATEIKHGNLIHDFRGNEWAFIAVSRIAQPGRSAKVEVLSTDGQGYYGVYYAEVFPGLVIVSE